ncbi:MAG TPA: SDR family NAD(P)-dependent oxidoreductase [Verrucomicrobiae bacterium]|nr:SDR family NAD(P)-dependent oxidoreductase [Verrucomicrobiae bacterium]
MDGDGEGPLAMITGGHGYLGRACAAAFAAQGWHVLAPGRDELDVGSAASVDHFFAGLDRIDALVNNAGTTGDALVTRMDDAAWEHILRIDLTGAFLCSRAAIRLMVKRRRGHLIHIGSWSGLRGNLGQANYAAAKAGLIGLSASLAKEYGGRQIQSNVVLPGFLETKMTAPLPPAVRERALAAHALGRFNTPGDAAAFIAFLARMPHVSGQVFQLDSRVGRWA